VGKGTEVTDPTSSTEARDRILGRVYKVKPNNLSINDASGWVYTYNKPYSASDLEKVGGNGSGAIGLGTINDNIIIEQSYE